MPNLKGQCQHARTLASALRQSANEGDDRTLWLGLRRVCSSCGRETIEHLEDGHCNDEAPRPINLEELRQSIAKLYDVSIANLLQRGEAAAAMAERQKNESRRRFYCRLAEAYAEEAMRMEAQRKALQRRTA